MSKKQAVTADEKFQQQDFDLFAALAALDRKDYDYWDTLTEEQQRKFVPYMLLLWMSAVKGSQVAQKYYLLSTNEYSNKHFFNDRIQNHPELQWKMLCAASPGIGKQFHQWIPHINSRVGELRAAATKKEVSDWATKAFPRADADTVKEYTDTFILDQHHKHRLATIHPELKYQDIYVLAALTTTQDIDRYEEEAGNT